MGTEEESGWKPRRWVTPPSRSGSVQLSIITLRISSAPTTLRARARITSQMRKDSVVPEQPLFEPTSHTGYRCVLSTKDAKDASRVVQFSLMRQPLKTKCAEGVRHAICNSPLITGCREFRLKCKAPYRNQISTCQPDPLFFWSLACRQAGAVTAIVVAERVVQDWKLEELL